MARRRTRRSGRGKKQKQSWADLATTINTAAQLGEPLIPAAQQAMAGDLPGALAAAKPALAEMGSPKNIAQIAVPYAVRGLVKKGLRMFGVRSPKIAGRRLF